MFKPFSPIEVSRPLVMGIVNTTPDSFSDGGHYLNAEHAIQHGLQLVNEGADILDIGGESTRPNAQPVPIQEELRRVIPVIRGLAAQTSVLISVDTFKPEVMRAAVEAGAGMINDVYALRQPGALQAAVELKVPVVLMHLLGEPLAMPNNPSYHNVVNEVIEFLAERISVAENVGIHKQQLLIDPGFGFGKTTAHNFQLLAELECFQALGVPVLAGLSRKRCIGDITQRAMPTERMVGSVTAHLIAVQKKAAIVRVHDVAATVDALKIQAAVKRYSDRRCDDIF